MGLRTSVTRSVLPEAAFLGILLPPLPERDEFFDALAAARSLLLGRAQLVERIEGGHDHIQDIGRSHRLGEDIADTSHFEHGAYAASRDHAGTGRSRLQED